MGLGSPYRIKKKRHPLLELLEGAGKGAQSYFQANMQKKILEAQLLGQEAEIEYKKGLLQFKEKELGIREKESMSLISSREASQEYQQSLLGLKEREFEVGQTQADRLFTLEERKITSVEKSRLAETKLAEYAQRQGVAVKMAANWTKIQEARAKVQAATTAHERDKEMANLQQEHDIALKKVAPAKAKESLFNQMFKKVEQLKKLKAMDQTYKLGEQTLDLNTRKFELDEQATVLQTEKFNYEKMQDWREEFMDIAKFDLGREDLVNLKEYDFNVRKYFDNPATDPYIKMQIEGAMKDINFYDWLAYSGDTNAMKVTSNRRKELAQLFKKVGQDYTPGTIEYKKKFLRKDEITSTPAEVSFPEQAPKVPPTLNLEGSLMDAMSPAVEAPTLGAPENPISLGTTIKESANAAGVDLPLIMAMMKAESTFNPDAASSAGAVGLLQLMPKTAESLGLSANERTDPMKNISAGISYLGQLKGRFTTEEQVLAAYNAGPSRAKTPPKETKDYVAKVQGYAKAYRADVNLLYKDLQTLQSNITGTPGEPAKPTVSAQIPDRGDLPYYQEPTPSPTAPQAYTVEWAIGTARRAGKTRLTKTDVESLKGKGYSDEDIEEIKDGIK